MGKKKHERSHLHAELYTLRKEMETLQGKTRKRELFINVVTLIADLVAAVAALIAALRK